LFAVIGGHFGLSIREEWLSDCERSDKDENENEKKRLEVSMIMIHAFAVGISNIMEEGWRRRESGDVFAWGVWVWSLACVRCFGGFGFWYRLYYIRICIRAPSSELAKRREGKKD
jgi:hypothetical protein